ncbi:acyltransferase [Sporosarcina trichiuri]|uniref:acyltransferase n=1 Tax=Sporosarcina trichiuri TaxID=3056445 RepID=UPI0025B44EAA|nr:acyltransferase family protein [Sporosarcina sp. 0.2-SM1T-5]WJY26200.1 acyltransferase family protein [Sporosarcina sp. 0.2-SM1T-5]
MKRLLYFDWLRILAAVAVVVIHVSAGVVTDRSQNYTSPWMAGNFYESLSRWAVPMFVMISGALMLSSRREIPTAEFLKKRMGKIVIPLLIWSVIYYANEVRKGAYSFSMSDFVERLATGDIMYHLWFLYMIAGLYLITPLLKVLVRNAKRTDIEYFLILWLIASVIMHWMTYMVGYRIEIELLFVSHYVGYYMLGYYLFTYDLRPAVRKLIYAGGLAGWLITFFMTYRGSVSSDDPLEYFWYDEHSPNVFLITIALFVLFKYTAVGRTPLPWVGKVISEASFGIYLIHVLVMQTLHEKFDFVWFNLHPAIGIPYKTVLVVAISTILVYIIKKVPVLRGMIP